MKKDYNIGLDIGTNSVGWAVVEPNTQKILKKGTGKNRKALWGVRLFDTAETAEKRRTYRSIRRRYERRRKRIKLLQEEFKKEMGKVDSSFFQKLRESKYHQDDVLNKTIQLTNEDKYFLQEYHNYKTIYHLRKELIDNKEKKDIRLVYLAIHHIIKYRGHFNYKGDFKVKDLNINDNIVKVFNVLSEEAPSLNISYGYEKVLSENNIEQVVLNIEDKEMEEKFKKSLEKITDNKNFRTEFVNMIKGNKFDVIKILNIDSKERLSISFKLDDYEEKYDELEKVINEQIEIIDALYSLYSNIYVKKLFNKSNVSNLSSLMVSIYNKHGKDLKYLKNLLKKDKKIYNEVFKDEKCSDKDGKCLYTKYLLNDDKYKIQANFSDEIIKMLGENITNTEKEKLLEDDFLPRITSVDNGKYPFQLNREELISIIENQGKYYNFLLDKTRDGTYNIVKLLEFKIPYYVGSLVSSEKSKFAWMIRKSDEKITPYNFDEVVDKEKTAEEFIRRMVSHCTYLNNEYALAKNSILYSKFKVFNELKQIKINGNPLTIYNQHNIYNDLFLKENGNITENKFKNYIIGSKDYDMYSGDDIKITGFSAEEMFANNMSSYIDFFGADGIFKNTNYTEEDADNIIELATIFEDKDILETKIRKDFLYLTELQIKKILSKNYKGWGNLSKKLLIDLKIIDKTSNSFKSVMDLLLETNENFMQIINNKKYNFQKIIAEENIIDKSQKLNYELVESLATSPATKRGIYQALKIVDEIVKTMGKDPKNIMIEMARSDEASKRTISKADKLTKLYRNNKKSIEGYEELFEQLSKNEKNLDLKLQLYFMQTGKCMYCGEALDINNLASCDVDHIIPRTLIADNSIDNKVLVCKECNSKKAASYVVPEIYRKDNAIMWSKLKKIGLISAKKYDSLTRKEYKKEDIEGFINRQLVETRQITKHIANILNTFYKKTNIVYVKASLSNSYRDKFKLFKFRELNNYHHAHDAYLAAVLGEYKEQYMKKDIDYEAVSALNKKFYENKMYKKLKYGFVINCLDEDTFEDTNKITKNFVDQDGYIRFNIKKFNENIENTLYRNDILISRKIEIKTGKFYDETIYKKGTKGIPLKRNMPTSKYGYYSSVKPSYAVFVTFTKKGKETKKMVGVPILLKNSSMIELENYFRSLFSIKKPDNIKVDKRKIPFGTLLIGKGKYVILLEPAIM